MAYFCDDLIKSGLEDFKKIDALIVARAVVEYYREMGEGSSGLLPVQYLPNIAPPYPHVFIESGDLWGVLVQSAGYPELQKQDTEEGRVNVAREILWHMQLRLKTLQQVYAEERPELLLIPEEKWLYEYAVGVINGDAFFLNKDAACWAMSVKLFMKGIKRPVCRLGLILDRYGRYFPDSVIFSSLASFLGRLGVDRSEKNLPKKLYEMCCHCYINPLLLSLSFLHCSNINKSTDLRVVSGRYVPFRYRVITIRSVEPTGSVPGVSSRRSNFYGYRGHFKDYREKGLFGRHKGLFWWSSQRGGKSVEHV